MKNDTKFALFEEWTIDPPGGFWRYYHFAEGENYDDLLWPIDEICDNIGWSAEDEEIATLIQLAEGKIPTAEYIRGFSWDNGGIGCRCVFLAEGDEIISQAVEFIDDALWFVLEEDEGALETFNKVREKPYGEQELEVMLKLLTQLIDRYNAR